MIPKRWKLSWIPAVMVALAVAACDRMPTEAGVGLEPAGELASTSDNGTYKKVEGTIPTFSKSQVIGPGGGRIVGAPGYELVVPAGAVKEAAVFEFASKNNGYIEMELHATAIGSPNYNDVGRAGFAKPVELHISYQPAGGLPEWKRHRVAWVREDGTLSLVRTVLYVGGKFKAVGYLVHFSDYALAYP